jgi:hypothetical protein
MVLHVVLVVEVAFFMISLLASDKIFFLLSGSKFSADSKQMSAPDLTPIFLF